MINYKFKAKDREEIIDAMSLKKAIIKYGRKPLDNDKFVHINWQSKKGNSSYKVLELPYKPRSERKGRL